MLDPLQVQHVERLLAQGGLSYRRIARLTGVAHPTVAAIARNEHGRAHPRAEAAPAAQAVRCLGCGGLVFPPCRLCRLRARGKGTE